MTYTCNICQTNSKDSEFYTGVTSRCKECHKLKVRENRKEKIEHYRQYDAKRYKDDERVRGRHRRYANTEAGKAAIARCGMRWRSENPEKRAAHVLLGNAVRDGRVDKPEFCEECGDGGKIHGHHHDYCQPLNVKWLCPKCHRKEHTR